MTKKEVYELMDKLGMLETYTDQCEDSKCETAADVFTEITCKDLPSLINFVDDLTLNNDLETIRKFLVCFFYETLC